MRGPPRLIFAAAAVLGTGCLTSPVLLRGNPAKVEDQAFYEKVKSCSSPAMDMEVGLRPPTTDPEEIWSRKTVRIEIRTRGELDGYNIIMPLTIVWEHTLKPGELRTFTDFPTFVETRGLHHEFSRSKMRKTFKKFLSEVTVSRPITRHTILELIIPYTNLVESCLYSFNPPGSP